MNLTTPIIIRLAVFTVALFAAGLSAPVVQAQTPEPDGNPPEQAEPDRRRNRDAPERQTVMRGIVIEDASERPITIADIRLLRPDSSEVTRTVSDESGRFRMEFPDSGEFVLTVSRVGFQPVMADSIFLEENDEVEVVVRLDPVAVVLQAVTVVAQRSAVPARVQRFRERAEFNQRAGIGRIWTRADLAELRPNSAQEVLDRVLWTNRCRPQILLDGLAFEGPMTMLSGEDIEGIEIYRSAVQIPSEFYRTGMCGLAMVWTRPDPPNARPLTWKRAIAASVLVLIFGLLGR